MVSILLAAAAVEEAGVAAMRHLIHLGPPCRLPRHHQLLLILSTASLRAPRSHPSHPNLFPRWLLQLQATPSVHLHLYPLAHRHLYPFLCLLPRLSIPSAQHPRRLRRLCLYLEEASMPLAHRRQFRLLEMGSETSTVRPLHQLLWGPRAGWGWPLLREVSTNSVLHRPQRHRRR